MKAFSVSRGAVRRAVALAALLLAVWALAAPLAHAQYGDKPVAPARPAVTPTIPGDPAYESPMRPQCEAELQKDAKWYARLRAQFESQWSFEWHEREASYAVTNNKHVIAAYAVVLVVLVGALVSMYTRQRRLTAEALAQVTELRDALKSERR
jgi:hypothetical protein